MSKFFTIEENQVRNLLKLFDEKIDNQFIELNTYRGYTDIAQYSQKYQNIHLISVPSEKLDDSMRLGPISHPITNEYPF